MAPHFHYAPPHDVMNGVSITGNRAKTNMKETGGESPVHSVSVKHAVKSFAKDSFYVVGAGRKINAFPVHSTLAVNKISMLKLV